MHSVYFPDVTVRRTTKSAQSHCKRCAIDKNSLYWPIVLFPTISEIVDQCKDQHDTVYQNGPVHRCRIRIWHGRKEEEHKSDDKEQNGDDVYEWAEATKAEPAGWELLAAKTLDQDDRDDLELMENVKLAHDEQ